ncbi:hypothetical protein LZ554_000383 [Drepanopeziza brunnea f. sp. 'monogermtubi']|nr:hypothetical protein LZ554_000383 [Drepanopeziza brunnea f. sp. 'monogermtubi']
MLSVRLLNLVKFEGFQSSLPLVSLYALKIVSVTSPFARLFQNSNLIYSEPTHLKSHEMMAEEPKIIIGRRPLRTSPDDRVNAYNHHSLAPWLGETGILTPLYFYRRAQEIQPFNVAR